MMTEICANCIHWAVCETEGALPNDYCGMYQDVCAIDEQEEEE